MLSTLLPAIVLAASAGLEAPAANTPAANRLSALEISALLAADVELPSNCEILGNPCFVIRCTMPSQPDDWPAGLYSCDVLNF